VSRIWKILVLAAATTLALASCYIIPFGAFGYISNAQLRTLDDLGLPVNEGKTPPDIEGTYLCDSLELYGTNIADDFPLGTGFANMVITFYNQGYDGSVLVSYTQGSESGSGLGAFVSGSGSDFSVYAQITGTSSGIDFEDAMVFSGTMSAGGIQDFMYGFIMTDKGSDPYDDLIEVGDARVFEEWDSLAANYYAASKVPGAPEVQLPAGNAK
jgi:hypothetical protein